MERREFVGGLAALAGVQWDEEGLDIESADEWEPLGPGLYFTARQSVDELVARVRSDSERLLADDGEFPSPEVQVYYDRDGVHVDLEGSADSTNLSISNALTPAQAREVAVGLYQAAEELEKRPVSGD